MTSVDKKKTKPWLFWLAILLFLVTSILTVIRTLHGSNDFDTFYNAGRAVLEHKSMYYTGEYYQTDPVTSPFLYPPFAACFFSLFAWMPLPLAAVAWNALNLFCFFAAMAWTFSCLSLQKTDLQKFWRESGRFDKILMAAVPAAILLDNLAMAQANILVFFLCVGSLTLWKKGRTATAGLVLAAAIWIKMTPLIFCVFYLAKKSWKTFLGIAIGSLLFGLLIPILFFGVENARLYSRQWVGRVIKPSVAGILENFHKNEVHPLKKSSNTLGLIRLADLLVDTNQSLPSAVTRLFLKDRNAVAFDTAFPIYAAQRYTWLPVIGGGLSREVLSTVLYAFQLILLALLFFLWTRPSAPVPWLWVSQTSLIFLSMTLFAPLTRSQQFTSFLYPYAGMFWIFLRPPDFFQRVFKWNFRIASIFYALLAIPAARAIGLGAWANLTLWFAFAWASFYDSRMKSPV